MNQWNGNIIFVLKMSDLLFWASKKPVTAPKKEKYRSTSGRLLWPILFRFFSSLALVLMLWTLFTTYEFNSIIGSFIILTHVMLYVRVLLKNQPKFMLFEFWIENNNDYIDDNLPEIFDSIFWEKNTLLFVKWQKYNNRSEQILP